MDVKSVISRESVTGDESKGKERNEKKLGSGKKRDKCANSKSSRERSGHELGDGYKNLKLSRGAKKSIEDMITKRKQQREAVEAILNSSLISSKKTEPSTKSMSSKRPPPTSVVSVGIRPPKIRKGLQ
uniref:Uncharacterized protein n=1 Tax=Salix viminalis TaxID=40686 RepID=A0A6N2MFJ8_SALVM